MNMRMVIIVFIVATLAPFMAQAAVSQETLTQYISDLQKNPNDNTLREKIIKHVQTMSPAPAVPKEAVRFEGRAEFAFKSAKSAVDFLSAAAEYEKALLIAPWIASDYFNAGLAYEKAEKFEKARSSFELYLIAAPGASDFLAVQKRIAGLEYAAEKAAKESSPAAIAEKKQSEYEQWLKKIDGSRFINNWDSRTQTGVTTLDVKGNRIIKGVICYRGCDEPGNRFAGGGWHRWSETVLNGREWVEEAGCFSDGSVVKRIFKCKISDDGNTATLVDCEGAKTYRRER